MTDHIGTTLKELMANIENRYINNADHERKRQQWEREEQGRARREALANSHIPAYEKGIIENRWENTHAYQAAKKALRSISDLGGNFLYLFGRRGTGKTVSACRLLISMVNSPDFPGNSCYFLPAKEYSDSLDLDALKEFERLSLRRGVLLLDDLGQETRNHHRLENIISHRHNHQLFTIITSNFSPDKLAPRYDQRIIDRIVERGLAVELTEILRKGVGSQCKMKL